MADHSLKPATDHRLGRPLPYQQANRPRAPLPARACKQRPALLQRPCDPWNVCGISPGFPELSPTGRQVAHVLLTRSPLYSPPEGDFRVRLACLIHAASVQSEPGSNSPKRIYRLPGGFRLPARYLVKVEPDLLSKHFLGTHTQGPTLPDCQRTMSRQRNTANRRHSSTYGKKRLYRTPPRCQGKNAASPPILRASELNVTS